MQIKEFEYIIAIAQEGNISKAAKHLYISQPALIRYLTNIETALGVELFDRSNKLCAPTQAGLEYLRIAENSIKMLQDYSERIHAYKNYLMGTFSIGITTQRGKDLLPYALPRFREKYPQLEINLFQTSEAILEEALASGRIQMALFTIEADKYPDYHRFETEIVFPEELLLVASNKHVIYSQSKPNCSHPWVDISELKNDLFLLMPPKSRLRNLSERLLNSLPFHAQVMEIDGFDTAIALASSNYGLTFTTSSHSEAILREKNLTVYCVGENPLIRYFVAACQAGVKPMPEPLTYFIKLLREIIQSGIQPS